MAGLQPHRSSRVIALGRRLGQHYLARKSILTQIAAAACGEFARVPLAIEIGPGKGALTEALLERAEKVVAIEVDPYLVHYLRQKFGAAVAEGRLELIEGDVLTTDLAAIGPRPVISGNLPYYITSPILDKVFSLGEAWQSAVFLVQAEVAARLTALPGTRAFGYLSVLAQVHANTELLFGVPKEAFRPPPKVESAVVRLTPRRTPVVGLPEFLRFAQTCFRHKRKTLRNNLGPVYGPVYGMDRVEALPEARLRAEQLSVAQLISLYEKLTAHAAG